MLLDVFVIFYLFAPCLFDLYLTLVLPIHTVAM